MKSYFMVNPAARHLTNLTSHCRGSRSAPGARRDNFCCAIYVSYCMKRLLLESRFALYKGVEKKSNRESVRVSARYLGEYRGVQWDHSGLVPKARELVRERGSPRR